MEVISQDERTTAELRTTRKPDLANDVHELAKTSTGTSRVRVCDRGNVTILTCYRLSRSINNNQPSGIAQLRQQSIDQSRKAQDDQMNIDDFIVPSSMGTPADTSPAPSGLLDLDHAFSSGLPINKRQQQIQAEELSLSRASAPSVTPFQMRSSQEFDYVPRHVRKTSIDERRVSLSLSEHDQD